VCFRFPQNAGKFLSGCTTGGLSSSTQLHRVGVSGMISSTEPGKQHDEEAKH
jgi:hypothetical protein